VVKDALRKLEQLVALSGDLAAQARLKVAVSEFRLRQWSGERKRSLLVTEDGSVSEPSDDEEENAARVENESFYRSVMQVTCYSLLSALFSHLHIPFRTRD
jgi:hypothetical protein